MRWSRGKVFGQRNVIPEVPQTGGASLCRHALYTLYDAVFVHELDSASIYSHFHTRLANELCVCVVVQVLDCTKCDSICLRQVLFQLIC